jgi:hypothetical protein
MLRDEVIKCYRIELDARGVPDATTRSYTGAC